jgi:hypothetical protein
LFKLSFAKQSATTHAGKSTNSQLAVNFHWQESTRVELLLYTGGAMTLVEIMLPADPF